jgi:hypothetical protein
MKSVMRIFLSVVLAAFIAFSCGNKGTKSMEEMISGENNKTWKAEKELNAAGDKDKLTRDERKEEITFSRNGTVIMTGADQNRAGIWKFDNQMLSIQYSGEQVTENFTILELDENNLKLRAADGSEMALKPD